ncbi:M23 family metallopeptidase [Cupriavidus pauculus]|jgi:murein DD-endopeptidase MepM/ murein hydrolase activator NlpD|uniref:M23 family metallopeptidase n=1 Tax=Cupriavidus pauculus TaxID=82633 RepID=A0A5P2H8C1_9BURK|nr:M23 family metallopeptidase [Cupriavidus pauculus]QET03589.1 M23 family metallopeptidase [Cupriavidus pauculus]
MQVIMVHPRGTRVLRFELTRLRVALALVLMCAVVAAVSSGLTWLFASRTAGTSAVARDNDYLRENLAVMATRVGELQARMVRLDALGERVSGLAGISPQDFDFRHVPPRGGPERPARSSGSASSDLTLPDLDAALRQLGEDADHRADYFNVVETTLQDRQLSDKRLPRVMPVATGYNASSFGARIDPFSGRRVQHDGVDFAAPAGTPIVAAAGGVVVAQEWHHEYGNMIDIDHGNGLKTRYAHVSRSLVRNGDLVRAGQNIAQVGSTGRSTGAHLHFEVHVDGQARNPAGFLMTATAPTPTDRAAIR